MRQILLSSLLLLPALPLAAQTIPSPEITSVSPSEWTSRPSPQTLTVTGTGFLPSTEAFATWYEWGSGPHLPGFGTTYVSSTTLIVTIVAQPTADVPLWLTLHNAGATSGSGYYSARLTVHPKLSASTPIIIDSAPRTESGYPLDYGKVRALVTPHSTAYLSYGGNAPRDAYSGNFVLTTGIAQDSDGDGIVEFQANDTPGHMAFYVTDSAGVMHKAAPPDATDWSETENHCAIELGPDGKMSRIVIVDTPAFFTYYGLLIEWFRSGVGAWWSYIPVEGGSSDADGVLDHRWTSRASSFSSWRGATATPVPETFLPGDRIVAMSPAGWTWSGILPNPLLSGGGASVISTSGDGGSLEGAPTTIRIVRTGGSDEKVSVDFQTVDGTAVDGVNYQRRSGSVEFAAGEFAKEITIPTMRDGIYSRSRTFSVVFTPHGATLGSANQTTMSIGNVDAPPAITVGDLRVNEGNAGQQQLNVPVTLSGATALPATVYWSAGNGTNGQLTFAPGETIKSVPLTYVADTVAGPNRVITIHIASFDGDSTISKSNGTVTIVDDDTPASVPPPRRRASGH